MRSKNLLAFLGCSLNLASSKVRYGSMALTELLELIGGILLDTYIVRIGSRGIYYY